MPGACVQHDGRQRQPRPALRTGEAPKPLRLGRLLHQLKGEGGGHFRSDIIIIIIFRFIIIISMDSEC